jgi:hypothetical protein
VLPAGTGALYIALNTLVPDPGLKREYAENDDTNRIDAFTAS